MFWGLIRDHWGPISGKNRSRFLTTIKTNEARKSAYFFKIGAPLRYSRNELTCLKFFTKNLLKLTSPNPLTNLELNKH